MNVGVLALQGNFESHRSRLEALGITTVQVRKAADLFGISGIVIPGGESSTLLKLLDPTLRVELVKLINRGLPVLATCAGVILLAKGVSNPGQDSLGLLDIDVVRNGYGRQIDSFIADTFEWTEDGEKLLREAGNPELRGDAVFIRAPLIGRIGPGVRTLATCGHDPVLVQSGSILGATFHPELSCDIHPAHAIFLGLIRGYSKKY